MSWEDEFQPDEPANEAPAPGDEPGEGEETPDPHAWLEDLDEETRSRVEALAQSRASSAAQDTEKRFRAGLGRWGNAQQKLEEQFGLVVDDRGNVATADPVKLQQFAQRFGAQGQGQQQAQIQPAEDPMPDPLYDKEGFRAWMGRQIDTAATAKAQAMVEPLRAGFVQQAVPAAETRARQMLAEEYNLGHLADDPEFGKLFSQALQYLPQEQWGDETAIETTALSLVPTLKRRGTANPAQAQQPRRSPAELAADAHRASLAHTGPTRSGTRQVDSRYSAEHVAEAKANGMTPDEWDALGDPDTARQFFDKQNRRGRR